MIAEVTGHAVAVRLAPRRAHELPHAMPRWVVADREHIWNIGAKFAFPSKRNAG